MVSTRLASSIVVFCSVCRRRSRPRCQS